MYYTVDATTGTKIDEFETFADAFNELKNYEEMDKYDGIYEEDFYAIINEHGEEVCL